MTQVKLFRPFLFLFLSLCIACGTDGMPLSEDEDNDIEGTIIGKWQMIKMEGWMKDEDTGEIEQIEVGESVLQLLQWFYYFNPDGSGGSNTDKDDEREYDLFTWTLQSSSLLLVYEDWETPFKVEKLTSTTLVLGSAGNDTGEGEIYLTFRRSI